MGLDDALGDVQPQAAAGGIVFGLGPVTIKHMGNCSSAIPGSARGSTRCRYCPARPDATAAPRQPSMPPAQAVPCIKVLQLIRTLLCVAVRCTLRQRCAMVKVTRGQKGNLATTLRQPSKMPAIGPYPDQYVSELANDEASLPTLHGLTHRPREQAPTSALQSSLNGASASRSPGGPGRCRAEQFEPWP